MTETQRGTYRIPVLVAGGMLLAVGMSDIGDSTRGGACGWVRQASAATSSASSAVKADSPLATLAQTDPRGLLHLAQQRCANWIEDYRCVLVRQERLDGKLMPVQRIAMRYRAEPHSVLLHWTENAGDARRASYVRGRHRSAEGANLICVEPAGAVARLFVSRLWIPVDGVCARGSSRRTMDQAGYLGTFGSIEAVNARAAGLGELQLDYGGVGEIDGRPTLVLVRRLPRSGTGTYPNALLVLHLDEAWLLPVGVYTYADAEGEWLLGAYTMTAVEVNVGLGDADFELEE